MTTATKRPKKFAPANSDVTNYVVWFYGQHLNAGRPGLWNIWGRRPTEAGARELMSDQQRRANLPMLASSCAQHWRITRTRTVAEHEVIE